MKSLFTWKRLYFETDQVKLWFIRHNDDPKGVLTLQVRNEPEATMKPDFAMNRGIDLIQNAKYNDLKLDEAQSIALGVKLIEAAAVARGPWRI